MNATVEMDKSGRLVVPKKMRDALHLRAGDKLSAVLEGDKLILAAEHGARGLYRDRGWLVFDSGVRMSEDEAVRQIEDDRNARMAYVSFSPRTKFRFDRVRLQSRTYSPWIVGRTQNPGATWG